MKTEPTQADRTRASLQAQISFTEEALMVQARQLRAEGNAQPPNRQQATSTCRALNFSFETVATAAAAATTMASHSAAASNAGSAVAAVHSGVAAMEH